MPSDTRCHELLEGLTDAQSSAVKHHRGPLMVLAGPGSGKTRVVTTRIARLISSGVDSYRIVALTFTNKAAEEMKLRVAQMVGSHEAWISTFHRFCSFLLRRYSTMVGLDPNFSIYDTADSKRTVQAVLEENNLNAAKVQPGQLLRAISNAKNRLLTPEQFESQAVSNVDVLAAVVYPLYQQRLLRSNAVDFDDLLVHVASMLTDNSELRHKLDRAFEYLLVDEYQDTNYAQYRIVQALSQDHPNLTVTGDPDQSIYGWRGAHLNNILDFERDFPDVHVVRLEHNFRSVGSIVHAADVLIANNRHRKKKSLISTREPGKKVKLHRFALGESEASWIAEYIAQQSHEAKAKLRDFAVLYRLNASSRVIEHALISRGIPYRVVNGLEFYQRKEIKDALAYLNLINNPCDDAAFLRIVNEPSRGVGPKNLQRISRFAADAACPLWTAASTPDCLATLSARPRKTMAKFVDVMRELMEPQSSTLGTFISRVIDRTGYGPALKSSTSEQDHDRLENLHELVVAADTFETELQGEATLERFLEQKALVNETDAIDRKADAVTLMTLHGAKGLEFPTVFLVGIEQGLLPHARAREEPLEEEEERRLFFVGITRAQDELHLSFADYRRRAEGVKRTVTSAFLTELPRESLDFVVHHDHFGIQEESPDFDDPFCDSGHFELHAANEDSTAVVQIDPGGEGEHRSNDDPSPSDSAQSRRSRSGRAPTSKPAPIMTAASMMGDNGRPAPVDGPPTPAADPDAFKVDMLVVHPEFGHGKVLTVSGRGPKRIARVVFFSTATERSFVLVHSALQPVQAS